MQFGNNIEKFYVFGRKRSLQSEGMSNNDATSLVTSTSEKLIRKAMLMRDEGKHAKALSLLQLIAIHGDCDSKQYAKYELALLCSQLGNQIEADRHLTSLGFTLKLTNSIFTPRVRILESTIRRSELDPVVTFDNALPATLLRPLLAAFSPSSVFWSEHAYPTKDFFSYNIRNDDKESLMKQVSDHVRPLLESHFINMKIASSSCSVEWWCHRRDKESTFAHQLHFDLDENALKDYKIKARRNKVDRKFTTNLRRDKGGSVRDDLHPLVSAVLYLRGVNGAPTLVTDQTLDADSVASQAWLCHPAENRLLAFDGKLLHGVVPFLPTTSASDSPDIDDTGRYRITIMMGWWAKNFESSCVVPTISKQTGRTFLSPNMAMPLYSNQPQKTAVMKSQRVSINSVTWPKMLAPIVLSPSDKAKIVTAAQLKNVELVYIPGPIWVPVASTRSRPSVQQKDSSLFKIKSSDKNTQTIQIHEMKKMKRTDSVVADTEFISLSALKRLRDAPSIGISDDEDEEEIITSNTSSSSSKKKSNSAKSGVIDNAVEYMSITDLNKLRDGDTLMTAAAKCDAHPPILPQDGEIVFVGKWFLKSLSEIRDDVLN